MIRHIKVLINLNVCSLSQWFKHMFVCANKYLGHVRSVECVSDWKIIFNGKAFFRSMAISTYTVTYATVCLKNITLKLLENYKKSSGKKSTHRGVCRIFGFGMNRTRGRSRGTNDFLRIHCRKQFEGRWFPWNVLLWNSECPNIKVNGVKDRVINRIAVELIWIGTLSTIDLIEHCADSIQ